MAAFRCRVFPQLLQLQQRSASARHWNHRIIIASIAIDFVVTLLAAAIGQFNLAWLNLAIIGLSSFQASMKGLHEHFGFKSSWLTNTQTLEASRAELWRFIAGVDEYKGLSPTQAAQECLSQLEALLETNNQQVLSRHRSGPQRQTDEDTETPGEYPKQLKDAPGSIDTLDT